MQTSSRSNKRWPSEARLDRLPPYQHRSPCPALITLPVKDEFLNDLLGTASRRFKFASTISAFGDGSIVLELDVPWRYLLSRTVAISSSSPSNDDDSSNDRSLRLRITIEHARRARPTFRIETPRNRLTQLALVLGDEHVQANVVDALLRPTLARYLGDATTTVGDDVPRDSPAACESFLELGIRDDFLCDKLGIEKRPNLSFRATVRFEPSDTIVVGLDLPVYAFVTETVMPSAVDAAKRTATAAAHRSLGLLASKFRGEGPASETAGTRSPGRATAEQLPVTVRVVLTVTGASTAAPTLRVRIGERAATQLGLGPFAFLATRYATRTLKPLIESIVGTTMEEEEEEVSTTMDEAATGRRR